MTTATTTGLRVHLGEPDATAELIGRPGVIQVGHYRLLSGLHTDTFLAFSHVADDPAALDLISDWLIPTIGPWCATLVLAPSTAGVGLGSTIARRLGVPLHLAVVNEQGRAVGVRGNPRLDGCRMLLVNDVVTTGAGLAALADAAVACGGTVAGATWFASRTSLDVSEQIGAPSAHITTVDLPAWQDADCPLCRASTACEDAIDLN